MDVPAAFPPPIHDKVNAAQLVGAWRSARAEVLCKGGARHARAHSFVYRLRGALGRALAPGASAAALKDTPCTFAPPCAYALFHGRFQPTGGGPPLPPPYVLSRHALGDDLLVRCRLFGAAVRWLPAFAEALAAAVQTFGIDGAGGQRTTFDVVARAEDADRPDVPAQADTVLAAFETPVVFRVGQRAFYTDFAFYRGLERRIADLARWHGLYLELDPEQSAGDLAGLARAPDPLHVWQSPWYVGRGSGAGRKREGILPRVLIDAPSGQALVLLSLGALTGVGGKLSEGQGQFRIAWKGPHTPPVLAHGSGG